MAEFDFIDWIRSQQQSSEMVRVPAGDDLAVLNWRATDDLLIVGADQVLDGVHFDSAAHSPRAIGRKAMNRNLSDCAAMACLPAAAITTIALPQQADLEFAKELYFGMQEAGDRFHCPIVGGDTGVWDSKLAVTVTILGRSAGVAPVTRSGAKPGDNIFVSGALGGSLRGRHMTFEPRLRLGRALGEQRLASAMIDLSDGLSRDLLHVCRASGVGAILYGFAVPVHDDVMHIRRRVDEDEVTPLDHALHDGEDYELLFTSAAPMSRLQQLGDITGIGEIVEEQGIWLQHEGQRVRLTPKGWEHEF